MNPNETIQLSVVLSEESGRPIIVDQHGRRVAAVLEFDVNSPFDAPCTVTLRAHLHVDGKKFVGRGA